MLKLYEIHTVNNIKFYFKLDLNPLTNEYEPHIFIRHTIEPYQAIAAYFNIDFVTYVKQYRRYEAYSSIDDLHIYYYPLKNKPDEIVIITAFNI